MYTKIRTLVLLFFCWVLTTPVMAQTDSSKVEMADGLRANGKIYVVVLVLVTILAGILIYVIRLDRKIGKLEKESK